MFQINIEIDHSQNTVNSGFLNTLECVHKSNLTYNEFFHRFMKTNKPVLIQDVSKDWECSRNWITNGNTVNFDYLKSRIPNIDIPVANCGKKYFDSHEKIEMKFWDFLDYWKSRIEIGDDKLYYLKDWHLKNDLPDYDYYEVPEYFASDWLNEYLIETRRVDYMFVYMGPKGTWTPFHADVFRSFSWSTNICGRKKWIFIHPNEELKLRDRHNNFPFSIDEELLKAKDVKYCVLIQNVNEAVFVPTGWYHQVWNLEDTISINHNWFNALNIETVWAHLKEALSLVKDEIENCRDMDDFVEHCQIMLRSFYGLNYHDFHAMLHFLLERRDKSDNHLFYGRFALGPNHIEYDRMILRKVIDCFETDSDVKELMEFNKNI